MGKMTEQTALRRLQLMYQSDALFMHGRRQEVEVAIAALEKQIPHKPKQYLSRNTVPVCGKCNGIMDLLQGELNYCPNCGQKLDWSV